MVWLREAIPKKYYRSTLLQWFGVAEKREKYSYYLHLYFNSQFKILHVDTNLLFISSKTELQLLPKTLYRFIDYAYHDCLLQLYYELKYVAPRKFRTIYLNINSKSIKAHGRLEVQNKKDLYKLKLENILILPDKEISDNYQKIREYNKEIIYQLYDEIHQTPLDKPIKIAEILAHYPYSKSTLYKMFQKVIGVSPSIVWRNRRIIRFKQHLLTTNESVTSLYWKFGYSNPSVLHRNFQKVFNLSPLAFRKKYRIKFKK